MRPHSRQINSCYQSCHQWHQRKGAVCQRQYIATSVVRVQMQRADPNLWNTANYSTKLSIAYDHPPTLFFSACRKCKAQAGSSPLHSWLRPRNSMLSLRAIYLFTAPSPPRTRCSSMDFSFSALCRCQGSGRLRPFYLTIMVQTGSQSQQNSSQLSFKRFFLFIFHIWSRMLQRARSRLHDRQQGAQ